MRRKSFVKPVLILFSFTVAVGVPLFLVLIALSNLIESSPQPLITASYALGAGLILLLLIMLPRFIKLRRRSERGLTYSDTYLDVAQLRSEVSLLGGIGINLLYAIFKLGAAAYYHTVLFAAEALFYLVLSGIRMLLVFHFYSGRRSGSDTVTAWKSYRLCGWQLLILAFAMSFVILQSLRQSVDYVNLTAVVYGSAFWAFYRLTMAITQLIKFRGSDRPLLSASKFLNFSAALMSIFILQNTLILHFGRDETFRQRMNTGFGVAISLAVIAIALWMILHGSQMIKNQGMEQEPSQAKE